MGQFIYLVICLDKWWLYFGQWQIIWSDRYLTNSLRWWQKVLNHLSWALDGSIQTAHSGSFTVPSCSTKLHAQTSWTEVIIFWTVYFWANSFTKRWWKPSWQKPDFAVRDRSLFMTGGAESKDFLPKVFSQPTRCLMVDTGPYCTSIIFSWIVKPMQRT